MRTEDRWRTHLWHWIQNWAIKCLRLHHTEEHTKMVYEHWLREAKLKNVRYERTIADLQIRDAWQSRMISDLEAQRGFTVIYTDPNVQSYPQPEPAQFGTYEPPEKQTDPGVLARLQQAQRQKEEKEAQKEKDMKTFLQVNTKQLRAIRPGDVARKWNTGQLKPILPPPPPDQQKKSG